MENAAENRAAESVLGDILYLDCQSGIAGDMLVAALLDAGADREAMDRVLASLPVSGFSVVVSRVNKSGISCCDFDVVLDAAHDGHDHDMAYLHGGSGLADGATLRHAAHDHDHDHDHDHGAHAAHHHGHHHEHRNLADIEAIIAVADMTSGARALATRAFRILAEAEAKAHALPLGQVHFHEVGAVDSIVDVIAAAVLFDSLNIQRVIVPVLADGYGTIRCQHGIIPVPAPATLNICVAQGLPLQQVPVEGELVTPTGAALVAALDPACELPARYRVCRVGLGAGKRTYSRPSILRAMLIEGFPATCENTPVPNSQVDSADSYIYKLECDMDDCSGEQLAYAAERLREVGAREVHWLPIFTKKGRPAYQLQVICAEADIERLQLIIFRETTTIGIRRQRMERTVLPRTIEELQTPHGPIRMKRVTLPDGTMRTKPEYDDCAAIAAREGLPLQEVIASARSL